MKAYVIDSRRYEGKTKNGKNMNGVFLQYIAENRNGKECKNSFISMYTLCGYVPQVGDVLDIYYNDRGFIDTVVPDLTRRCKFIIENVSLKN